ncbi:Cochaperone protein [Purpureocillium takamizusanense]|uniref:Cochaperone protein n=1 Tax=Purpureocillium takamizusanense TaxID=2060973 RepID=A0A9Q8QH50_9HYPO|nr:Cochaperone protein [Purpureocillium takamizusanense]UNI18562.1 Cochaperone protein [Purpureocillium takamizusanense]
MSHITLARQGLDAVEAKQWDEAVTKLSKALQQSTNPAWLVGRSKALVGLKRFDEALDDANLAWHQAWERNKRPLLVDAQYRRAIAYYRLGQLANADCCCVYAMRLVKGSPAKEKEDPKLALMDERGRWKPTLADAMEEARTDDFNVGDGASGMALATKPKPTSSQSSEWRLASTLRMQILRALDSLPEDDPARVVTTSLVPEEKKLAVLASKETMTSEPTVAAQPAAKPVVPHGTPLRLQDFQSNTTMSVSIFSKGNDKEKLKVEFTPSAVRMDPVVYPGGEEKEFVLELWGEIDAAASKYTVTANKVELTLAKKTPGKWAKLQKDEDGGTAAAVTSVSETPKASSEGNKEDTALPAQPPQPVAEQPKVTPAPAAAATTTTTAGPSYPSSSRTGPKNWDKIGAEAGDDEEDADVNLFFKKLYKNATPEQQRAMMKSFTESNGTTLSTDWNDVKERKVETKPPEGVEAKKWS